LQTAVEHNVMDKLRMSYLYEKRARAIAIRNIIIAIAIYLALAGIIYFYVSRDDFPLPLLVISVFVGLLVGSVFFKDGIKLFNNDGVWKVSVDQNGIVWESPDEEVDSSFKYSIHEISSTETIVKHSKSKKGADFSYFLCLKCGKKHKLSGHAGANLKKILLVLESLGIKNDNKVIYPKAHIKITDSQ